jgi:hypothetical protein
LLSVKTQLIGTWNTPLALSNRTSTAVQVRDFLNGHRLLSGTQPFKARLDNVVLSPYNMYWSVDGGQPNLMSDNSNGGDHKEVSVDLSGWTWRDAGDCWGPFSVNFIAKDLSGNLIQQKAVSIYVIKTSLSNSVGLSYYRSTKSLEG